MINRNLIMLAFLLGLRFISASEPNYNESRLDTFTRTINDVYKTDFNTYLPKCIQWSKGIINWTIISSDIGHVKFLFPTSPTSLFKVYSVVLYVLDEKECNYAEIPECKHSKKIYKSDLETAKIEYDIRFVFTGRYYFKITLLDTYASVIKCHSNIINITTNYTKELIVNSKVQINLKYIPKSETIKVSWSDGGSGTGLSLAEVIVIELTPESEQYSIKYTLNNSGGESEGVCSGAVNRPTYKICDCHWKDEYFLCTFSEIIPGNYTIFLEVYDLRCPEWGGETLWVTGVGKDCSWKYNFVTVPEPASKPIIFENSNLLLIWLIIIGIAITLSIAFIFCIRFSMQKYIPKKLYQHNFSNMSQINQQLSTLSKLQILLLYPRDCDDFMTVMKCFRCFLQEFSHTQVYDIWDVENWDKVIEVGHQWTMKYITDKNVKVIIIASPCSKIFEYALINHKTVEYIHEPNCLDNIFMYSFKESVTLTNYSSNNYKRFFVARLEEPECEANKFSIITPCTMYTIPQHLRDLMLLIHNMDSSKIISNTERTSNIDQLINSLEKLKTFKLNNPNYLNELIKYS